MIELSVAQARIYTSPKRFRVAICGRRFGKTFLALHEIWRAATRKRHQHVLYVGPTYSQAKDDMWLPMMSFIPPGLIMTKNVADMSVELVNGSMIRLRGAQTERGIRGKGNDFVVMDEISSVDANIWEGAIQPSLSDREGSALFIGTPVGYNWVYDLWNLPNMEPTDIDKLDPRFVDPRDYWQSFQFTTLQGGNVTDAEIQLRKATTSPEIFAQEYQASFQSLSGRVYSHYDPVIHDTREMVINPKLPILVGLDFNVNPMSAIVAQIHRTVKKKKQLHILDEICIPNSTTFMMADEIKNRFPGRRIIIYPDSTGNSRKTSSTSTDHQILRDKGLELSVQVNPRIPDRINECQGAFLSATNETKLYVHPRCQHLKKSLAGLCYKEGTTLPDKTSGLDHMADAMGYLVHQIFPIGKVSGGQQNIGL